MTGLGERLLELVFPSRCQCCGELTGGGSLCQKCAQGLEPMEHLWQTPCYGQGADAIAAVYAYQGTGGRLMRRFKFEQREKAYQPLKEGFEAAISDLYESYQIDSVIPVPMERGEEQRRGFNQSQRIAQGLAKRMGLPCQSRALKKREKRRAQHSLSRGLRRGNVEGLFSAVKAEELTGKTILLVDDIVTTGATFSACAQVLRQAGAKRVWCAAVLAARLEHDGGIGSKK